MSGEFSKSDLFEISRLNVCINTSLTSLIDYSKKSTSKNNEIPSARIIHDYFLSEAQDVHDHDSLLVYLFNSDWLKKSPLEETFIFEYSLEYGFLHLPPEARHRLNIEVLFVT